MKTKQELERSTREYKHQGFIEDDKDKFTKILILITIDNWGCKNLKKRKRKGKSCKVK